MPKLAFAVRGVLSLVATFGAMQSTPRSARAQAATLTSIRVHVADSAGVPIAGAEVTLIHGLNQVLANGLTDARGDQAFSVPLSTGDDELVVRKLGYTRVNRFFNAAVQSLSFNITLSRTAHSLDTVRVAAREDDVRRKSYFIDAEEIENSPRVIVDAMDIVTKLRPDMIWGRQGEPDRIDQHVSSGGVKVGRNATRVVQQAQKYGYCPPVQNVWVNGARIRDVPINPMSMMKRNGNGVFLNATVATVLGSIKPEHIAEMEYHACTEVIKDAPAQATNAIMVTLKDGIMYEPGVGSFVIDDGMPINAVESKATQRVIVNRILGVFDEVTGDPVPGVEVVDVATGTIARTTSTGTVSLAFLPLGESQIRIQRDGYAVQTMPITLSPRDTLPVTIVLTPKLRR